MDGWDAIDESRRIGPFLMSGLIALPAVFVWFLLRRGYAGSTRRAAFAYAFGPAALALITELFAAVR